MSEEKRVDDSMINAIKAGITVRNFFYTDGYFGHKKSCCNPKMLPYIYGISNNGTHIIDLQKTVALFKRALGFIESVAARKGRILFVGSKPQAVETIEHEAKRCGQYYVTRRWLGGTLTNWSTISSNIKILANNERKIDRVKKNLEHMTKKEYFCLIRKQEKLELDLAGIRNMGGMPDLLFVVDINKEYIAVNEAARLGIPVVALIDTNTDPDLIKYPIPCNDDSIKVIKYCCENVANAVLAGIEKDLSSRPIQQNKRRNINISNKDNNDHGDKNVISNHEG